MAQNPYSLSNLGYQFRNHTNQIDTVMLTKNMYRHIVSFACHNASKQPLKVFQ